jgi:ABC-type multidrug transport system fused ATPase/permease subunit
MDKLEYYLDQVCRSIGGPRALRDHVRQELREHLLDAVAQHKAAGLPEEQALARALEDFGGPEEVRSELEATHGHRLLPVVIDKAMQWKERTMRAKWLWTTWATVAAVVLVVLEVLFIAFNGVYILPKYQKLARDGVLDFSYLQDHGISWMARFLDGVHSVGHYTTQILLVTLAAWGLFEWRVKSENKSFMRLSMLGTAAVGLMIVVILTTGSLVVMFTLVMPPVTQMSRPWAIEQVATIDAAIGGVEQALTKNDWGAMQEQADQASNALGRLSSGPAVASLTRRNEPPTVEELQARVKEAREDLRAAQLAILDKDAERVQAALQKVQEAMEPVRAAAKRPAK